jgi:tetratricopeptide (TPR) repeat protein
MRNTTFQGFASFALTAVLAAAIGAAQSRDHYSPVAGAKATGSNTDTGSPIVPIDVLRHPMSPKVRKLLVGAMDKMDSGHHAAAIEQLSAIQVKYPDSAPYVQDLLGVEYVKTDRFDAAVNAFDQAVLLLPHDAMTHYYLGLALICTGDYDRATKEVQRALELDPTNTKVQARLDALLRHNQPGD